MSKLLSALVLLFASAQLASATPTSFYLSGNINNSFATASGVIVIDPVTGAVQPGTIFLSVMALPIYNLPAETLDLTLQSVTSTHASGSPGFSFIDGITTLTYADAAGTTAQIFISADNGSLIGYSGGLCTELAHSNCVSDISHDVQISDVYGPEAPGGPHEFGTGTLTATPEPSSLALLSTGVLSACALARRHRTVTR